MDPRRRLDQPQPTSDPRPIRCRYPAAFHGGDLGPAERRIGHLGPGAARWAQRSA